MQIVRGKFLRMQTSFDLPENFRGLSFHTTAVDIIIGLLGAAKYNNYIRSKSFAVCCQSVKTMKVFHFK